MARSLLIFFVGLLLGGGAAAYYFINVRLARDVALAPVVVEQPALSPSATVVPPIVVAPAAPPVTLPTTTLITPSPPPIVAANPVETASTPVVMPPVATAPALPPITPAEPVAIEPLPVAKTAPATSPTVMRAGELIVPVDGIRPNQLTDTYNQRRDGNRPHEALDIMAPRGTPVLAAADGKIVKLFDSKPGGLTIYEFDTSGTVAYYYAHLDRYAAGIGAGLQVKQGEVLGYVGSTGNASPNAPHLHFAIFKLGPEKNWWQGTPINPYPMLTGKAGS